jgi:hypothetical protein
MHYLAQTYTTTYNQTPSSGVSAIILLIYIAVIVVAIVAFWKVFVKAGEAGWKSIIPIYNVVIMCRIAGMSGWYTLLYLIPLVNIIFILYLYYKIAQTFGYGVGMTILMLFLIGWLIIGFGDSHYHGAAAGQVATSTPSQTPPAPSV